jgi:RimJ/RimL family protein N-acetyltransferase
VLGAPRLIALIRPENARSIRVAERLGLRQVREDTLNGVRVLVFGVERPSVP